MNWILPKAKITEVDFKKIEEKLNVHFPSDFKKVILEHNGASPQKMLFDTEKTKERVAEYLLSFNTEDRQNILSVHDLIGDRLGAKLIPIMRDPFGNYICFKFTTDEESAIYFFNHENSNLEYISKTFSQFLNDLYE